MEPHWKEEFEKKLFDGDFANPVMEMNFSLSPLRLTNYIESLLESERKELAERVKNLKKENHATLAESDDYQNACKHVLALLKN